MCVVVYYACAALKSEIVLLGIQRLSLGESPKLSGIEPMDGNAVGFRNFNVLRLGFSHIKPCEFYRQHRQEQNNNQQC